MSYAKKRDKMAKLGEYLDITGQKFSMLTAMWPITRNRHHHTVWLCSCECGNYAPVVLAQLRNQESKSCGCLKIQHCRDRATHGKSGTAPFHMLCSAKGRAKKLSLPFDLNMENIIIPEKCPLLGIPLRFNKRTRNGFNCNDSPTLDRLVPEKGYTKENTVVISYRANRIKNDSSLAEFELIAKNWRAIADERAR